MNWRYFRRVIIWGLLFSFGISQLGSLSVFARISATSDIFVDSGQELGATFSSYDVALGDLDGDTDLDAFVANHGQANQVWKNNGSGTFTDSGQTLGSAYSRGVALGDLDRDGDLDAFVANSGTDGDKVWINQGGDQSGTPGNLVSNGQSLGSESGQDVALGDLDGDGDLDAYVANYNNYNRIWINKGGAQGGTEGQFQANSATLSSFLNTYGCALGDADGDGDLDLLEVNAGTQGNIFWINQGGQQGGTEGSFVKKVEFLPGGDSYAGTFGDLDGDGDIDVIIANYDEENTVWFNDGGAQGGTKGDFTDSGQTLGTAKSRHVVLVDLDADNDLDAVFAGHDDNEVYLNDGSGNFNVVQTFEAASSWAAAIGPLHGGSSMDAFIANTGTNAVWFGANHFESVGPAQNAHNALENTNVFATVSGTYDTSSVTADSFTLHGEFLGDVSRNIPSLSHVPEALDQSKIWMNTSEELFPGELVEAALTSDITDQDGIPFAAFVWQFRAAVDGGSGVYTDTGQHLGTAIGQGVDLADLDNDGDLDAFVANGNYTANDVWINQGGNQGGIAGTFQSVLSFGNSKSTDVALGDLDSDGSPDAFVTNTSPNKVWRGLGNGNFADYQTLGDADSRAVALGDLDGDGDLDAFVANHNANKIWINDGTAHFTDSGQNLGSNNSHDVALGDFDLDGDLDALVVNLGDPHVLWWNNGDATFTADSFGPDWGSTSGVALGDLNADGHLDAFIVNYASANEIWINQGSGVFTITQELGTAPYPPGYAVGLGDLNQDGDLDAFVVNYNNSSGDVPDTVWLNNSGGGFTDSGQRIGVSWSYDLALGDLDGDGDLDAFIANHVDGNEVWFNDEAATPPPEPNQYSLYLPMISR